MVLDEPRHLRQLLALDRRSPAAYGGFGGFGDGLPADPKAYVSSVVADHPEETDRLFANDDGLNGAGPSGFVTLNTGNMADGTYIHDHEMFSSLWNRALAISDAIAAFGADPFASALVQKANALEKQILDALVSCRRLYPYTWNLFDNAGMRPIVQQGQLWGAMGNLRSGLRDYLKLGPMVDDVTAQIHSRQDTENTQTVQLNLTNISKLRRVQVAADADTQVYTADVENAKAVTARAKEQDVLATQHSQSVVHRASQPHVLGLPLYSTVLPLAGAGLLAMLVLHFAKPRATA